MRTNTRDTCREWLGIAQFFQKLAIFFVGSNIASFLCDEDTGSVKHREVLSRDFCNDNGSIVQ